MITDSYKQFLQKFFEALNNTNIRADGLDLDHLGYQTSSAEDYEKIKQELMSIAVLAEETILNDRRIGIFVLDDPLDYEGQKIEILEIIEPEKGSSKTSDWEHVEFMVEGGPETLVESYPVLDWDSSALYRDRFPMLKLKLSNGLRVKFPRKGLKSQLAEKGVYANKA